MACRRCWVGCVWAVCLSLSLIWSSHVIDGAISRHSGLCMNEDIQFKPGQTFYKGCDKCFCHDAGYICFSPTKPTSWPTKCQRIQTNCVYRLVYRGLPGVQCRANSWV